jgi:hypothetical protein
MRVFIGFAARSTAKNCEPEQAIMAISDNNGIGSGRLSLDVKHAAAKLRDRAIITVGAIITVVAMAGWLYFLGRVAFTVITWMIG